MIKKVGYRYRYRYSLVVSFSIYCITSIIFWAWYNIVIISYCHYDVSLHITIITKYTVPY